MSAKVNASSEYPGMKEHIPNWSADEWDLLSRLKPLFEPVIAVISVCTLIQFTRLIHWTYL
jgi:hypothetical protein